MVAATGARLFAQAYGPTHPEPELSRYLGRAFSAEQFTREIAEPTAGVLVTETAAGQPVGYAHVRVTTGAVPVGVMGRRPVEVVRFYVDAALHGRGVAQALMAACEREARGQDGDALWLAVWQQAARPLAFYHRCGFAVVGTTTFEFGERRDADYVMARALSAHCTPPHTG
jgi:GNAT superfamily N-acetyltransferase